MKTDRIQKKLFAVFAVLAMVAVFYVGGLYEQYLISGRQFVIMFAALIATFIYSAGEAGAFDAPSEKEKP